MSLRGSSSTRPPAAQLLNADNHSGKQIKLRLIDVDADDWRTLGEWEGSFQLRFLNRENLSEQRSRTPPGRISGSTEIQDEAAGGASTQHPGD